MKPRRVQLSPSCDMDAGGDPVAPKYGSARASTGYSQKYLAKRVKAGVRAVGKLGELTDPAKRKR